MLSCRIAVVDLLDDKVHVFLLLDRAAAAIWLRAAHAVARIPTPHTTMGIGGGVTVVPTVTVVVPVKAPASGTAVSDIRGDRIHAGLNRKCWRSPNKRSGGRDGGEGSNKGLPKE
jgi:hypothetical protein